MRPTRKKAVSKVDFGALFGEALLRAFVEPGYDDSTELEGEESESGVTIAQMRSKDTPPVPVPDEYAAAVSATLSMLGKVHAAAQEKEGKLRVVIVSGWRTPEHNSAVGGAERSMHLIGLAVDFKFFREDNTQVSTGEIDKLVADLMRKKAIPAGGHKAYPRFNHIDRRGKMKAF